ncbi:hypothetical protein [Sutcliffiella halmapala]|uniref:hypothetical protein n=1 Tax=Sutcliffiella halmapala TaxID=79882 RepID=UPI000995C4CF|nr:hypothetical protein [Sutcliffiella halmapala]
MYWETLPSWFWFIYYLFLFATFGTAVSSLIKKRLVIYSFIVFVLVLTIPVNGMINGIERGPGLNELEHLIQSFQQREGWSLFIVTGFVILFIWWIVFFKVALGMRRKDQLSS